MSDDLKLLNCPCCGSDDIRGAVSSSVGNEPVSGRVDRSWVYCASCGIQTEAVEDFDEVVEVWNRRTPSTRIKELEEALRAVLAEPAASCDGYADAQSDDCPFCRARSALSQEGGE